MPSFAANARARSEHKPRVPCALGAFLQSLTMRERNDIDEALADHAITGRAIMAELVAAYPNMTPLSDGQVYRHLKNRRNLPNGCACA